MNKEAYSQLAHSVDNLILFSVATDEEVVEVLNLLAKELVESADG